MKASEAHLFRVGTGLLGPALFALSYSERVQLDYAGLAFLFAITIPLVWAAANWQWFSHCPPTTAALYLPLYWLNSAIAVGVDVIAARVIAGLVLALFMRFVGPDKVGDG